MLQQVQPTTLTVLQPCTGDKAYNVLAKIEQTLTPAAIIAKGDLIMTQGNKLELIKQIIKVIEFYLKVIGREMEIFQIQILAGDLYTKFRTDTIDDIILFFKMIRNDELGKIGYQESLRDKIIAYVVPYMQYKSEQRERLIKVKKRKLQSKPVEKISEEAFEKFTELQNSIKTPAHTKAATFSINSILKSSDAYHQALPASCKKLSDSDLKYELLRTQYNDKYAYEILLQEQQRRKDENPGKKKKKDK